MNLAEMSFYPLGIGVQSFCILASIVSLYRAGKILDDAYKLMMKELWSLRGLIEKIKSREAVDKESGSNEKFTATDL